MRPSRRVPPVSRTGDPAHRTLQLPTLDSNQETPGPEPGGCASFPSGHRGLCNCLPPYATLAGFGAGAAARHLPEYETITRQSSRRHRFPGLPSLRGQDSNPHQRDPKSRDLPISRPLKERGARPRADRILLPGFSATRTSPASWPPAARYRIPGPPPCDSQASNLQPLPFQGSALPPELEPLARQRPFLSPRLPRCACDATGEPKLVFESGPEPTVVIAASHGQPAECSRAGCAPGCR